MLAGLVAEPVPSMLMLEVRRMTACFWLFCVLPCVRDFLFEPPKCRRQARGQEVKVGRTILAGWYEL